MPWDHPVVLAACDGGGVRLPVCVYYEISNAAALRIVASHAGLGASPWLAYMPQCCYMAEILIRHPVVSRSWDILARGSENPSLSSRSGESTIILVAIIYESCGKMLTIL